MVADELDLKNRREAIIEFLRIGLDQDCWLEKDLMHEFDQRAETCLKEVAPYNEADMYLQHCSMLVAFGESPD
jgi:NADH:ubiquinone oxidoreductase subunit E